MTIVIFVVLILLILGVIAAVVALAPTVRSPIGENAPRPLPESRRPLAGEANQPFEYFVPTMPAEPRVGAGQRNLAVSDAEFIPWVLPSEFEEGEINSEGIDWLTGQSRDECECEDCGNWRKLRVGN